MFISSIPSWTNISCCIVARMATLTSRKATPAEKTKNYFDHLRTNLKSTDDGGKRESLGNKRISDRDAVGYRLKKQDTEITRWGDAKTGLPILVVMKPKGLPSTTITMSDFEFDVPMNKALFSIVPPPDYSINAYSSGGSSEQNLTAVLKLIAQDNGNKFPDILNADTFTKTGMKYVEMKRKFVAAFGGRTFLQTLRRSPELKYAGAGVALGDGTRPILWYQPKDSKSVRVIYGDLKVKDQPTAPQVTGVKGVDLLMLSAFHGERSPLVVERKAQRS